MPISESQANAEIKAEVNKDFASHTEGIRINNRNLSNVHPCDCVCPICSEFYNSGQKMSQEDECKKREELNYPSC